MCFLQLLKITTCVFTHIQKNLSVELLYRLPLVDFNRQYFVAYHYKDKENHKYLIIKTIIKSSSSNRKKAAVLVLEDTMTVNCDLYPQYLVN